jgi:hypothetical protein
MGVVLETLAQPDAAGKARACAYRVPTGFQRALDRASGAGMAFRRRYRGIRSAGAVVASHTRTHLGTEVRTA